MKIWETTPSIPKSCRNFRTRFCLRVCLFFRFSVGRRLRKRSCRSMLQGRKGRRERGFPCGKLEMVSGEREFRSQEGFVYERGFHALDLMENVHFVSGHRGVEFPQRWGGLAGKRVSSKGFGEFREEYRRSLTAFARFEIGEGSAVVFEKLLIRNAFRERLRKRGYDLEKRDGGRVIHFFRRYVLSKFEGYETVLLALGLEVRLDEASRIGPSLVLLFLCERADFSIVAAPEFVDEFSVANRRTLKEDALRYVHASGLRAFRPTLRIGSGTRPNR